MINQIDDLPSSNKKVAITTPCYKATKADVGFARKISLRRPWHGYADGHKTAANNYATLYNHATISNEFTWARRSDGNQEASTFYKKALFNAKIPYSWHTSRENELRSFLC